MNYFELDEEEKQLVKEFELKSKAIKEGLPYQTLASSILHKSVS